MDQTYYIFGARVLKRKDDTLVLILKDNSFRPLPVEKVRDIYLFSETDVNLSVLRFLGKKNINLHIFDYYGHYNGSYIPRESFFSGQLLIKQVRAFEDMQHRVLIAKEFILASFKNMLRNLKYYRTRGKNLEDAIVTMESLSKGIDRCNSVEELMGVEGSLRKVYYSAWSYILKEGFDLEKREYRPATSPVNAMISYVNMLIYTTCLTEIYKTQLNPTISYLHAPGTRRFSLCLDIAEVFKPVLADRLIFSLINREQIKLADFNGINMSEKATKIITRAFDDKLKETIKNKELNRNVSYRTLIRLECWKIVKHLMEDAPYNSFKMEW